MKLLSLKNIIRIIILTPLTIYLSYTCYHAIKYDSRPTYLDCGKIESKANDEVSIKHGVETIFYLNVRFEKTGFQSIKCSPTTYFSHEKGDNICFTLNKEMGFWYDINQVIGLMVLAMGGFALIACLIYYLVPDFN